VLVLLLLVIWAAFIGIADINPLNILSTFIPGMESRLGIAALTSKQIKILTVIRFPRIAVALISGAGLGICGAVMQATTGNSLASPFTTGI
jgi:iron complex transport system permease protein